MYLQSGLIIIIAIMVALNDWQQLTGTDAAAAVHRVARIECRGICYRVGRNCENCCLRNGYTDGACRGVGTRRCLCDMPETTTTTPKPKPKQPTKGKKRTNVKKTTYYEYDEY